MSHDLISIHIHTFDRRDIGRRRHVLQDRVQKLLNTLVPVCGTAAYRDCLTLTGSLSQHPLHVFDGRLVSFQVFHHQIVVQIADLLYQLGTVKLCVVLHILRNLSDGDVVALLIIVNVGLHLHQVDDPLEIIFLADRQLQTDRVLSKSGTDLLYGIVEIGAKNVHLVDESHSRNVVCVCLTPYIFRLRLNTALGAEYANRTVQYTQGTLNLYGEVHVSRSINDIDPVLQGIRLRLAVLFQCPVTGGGSGSDRDTSLLLLLHPVHCRSTFMSITDLVVYAGIVENTLCQRSLAGIDMSHDTNISGSL